MKDLLRTEHLSRADVELLLSTAAEFAENPLRSNTALANKTVAIYMTKPSTRTRLSSSARLPKIDLPFQVAEPDLLSLSPDNVLSKVVLPAPFAPIIAASSPWATVNETLLIALIAP